MVYNPIEVEEVLINERREINYYVDCIKPKYKKIKKNGNGIYIFWYYNKTKKLHDLNRKLFIDGPKKEKQKIEWNWNLENEYVCLYVGKTRDMQKRISQHLLLDTDNLGSKNGSQLHKKTTACQLRSGFDYLYSKKENVYIKNELMEHLYLSIYYEDDFTKRFYLEDYLIGKLRPWFNVDSER